MVKPVFRGLVGLLLLSVLLAACSKAGHVLKFAPSSFQEGKDYQRISDAAIIPPPTPQAVVDVKEFFSYACPACYHFEPTLEQWLAKKPAYVKFERVPIVFQPTWRSLARVFYIAEMFGIERQITPAIFKAIHVEGQDLSDLKKQATFFAAHGITQAEFENMASFSPGIDAQLLRSDTLAREDKILAAPTLVIGNRYKVDPSLTGGDPTRFLQITDFLIKKVHTGEG